MSNQATIIKKTKDYLLYTKWIDGSEFTISMEALRRACPCAECTGESIGDKIYSRPKPIREEAGTFELTALTPVGNYALAAVWANGHSTGIYSWVKLYEICKASNIDDPNILEALEKKYEQNKKKIQLKVL